MTRKEFVLNTVEEMKENPRAILAGHGIKAAVLQEIIARPDVMSKLATVLYSTRYAKKGAKGLKKAQNFRIFGYKNFPEFNAKAREDVEVFFEGLSEKDQATFNNAESILTILMLPGGKATGEETDEMEIITGKSTAVTFETAVKKEYKIPGGVYITVMMGDSVARPAEEKIAKRKEKKNKRVQSKRTPAKIKAELKLKARKKLDMLEKKRKDLEATAYAAEKEVQQFRQVGKQFGARNNSPININAALKDYDKGKGDVIEKINTLSPEMHTMYKKARSLWKRGNKVKAAGLLRRIGDEDIANYVKGGEVKSIDEALLKRKQAMRAEINRLTAKNEEMLTELGNNISDSRRKSIKSMLSKNNAKIRSIRTKLGTYKNISQKGMMNKSRMLKETHAAIQANIEKGESIRQSLDNAIRDLDAKDAEKTIIKQQVIEQVSNGMPMQYAVQQAIQQTIQDVVEQTVTQEPKKTSTNLGSSSLSGSATIADVLSTL